MKNDSKELVQMKKPGIKSNVMVFLLVFCVFFAVLIGCNNGSTDNHNNAALVCLGDSLTAGYGAAKPGEEDKSKSYPAYLQNKVNIPVINAGISGDTTAQGLARLIDDVLSYDPQIVIILLGANDFGRLIPVETTRNNLQEIISKIDDNKRKIYLAKFYTEKIARELGNKYGITDYAFQTAVITLYDSMYETLATQNDVTLIEDIWHGVWGTNMSDLIHPNAKGYEKMANNIFSILQPHLQKNNLLK